MTSVWALDPTGEIGAWIARNLISATVLNLRSDIVSIRIYDAADLLLLTIAYPNLGYRL